MSLTHGIRTLGVLGAGQMGTGIALVSALRAKVPVLLHDRSPEQITKGLGLIDKLLAKDVAKGRLTNEQAKEARDRVNVVGREQGIKGLRGADMVVEVCKCLFSKSISYNTILVCATHAKQNVTGSIREPLAQTVDLQGTSGCTSTRSNPSYQHKFNQHHKNCSFSRPRRRCSRK